MNKKLINWLGLSGVLSFLSYAAAVIFSPMDFRNIYPTSIPMASATTPIMIGIITVMLLFLL